MAKVKKNVIIEGLSGRVGNLLFKQYGDKTVVTKWPEHDPNRKPTPGEAHQRGRIKDAAAMAKSILATDEGLAYYQAARHRLEKHSAYHTAVFDFFGMPEVVSVHMSQDGNLLIEVQDNVGVRQVQVEIDDIRGFAEPLEEEPCAYWRYHLNSNGPWSLKIYAEDGMKNIKVWEGTII
ncbi:MAG: hypothetical protein ISR58_12530 [Anaerolineales bacterium]|nr:hypothetical protein [Chloroflexota bacterium]MBL6982005.1 hypothetical protein [Anaerolineales bacterium]